jgi:hypothetical protein
MRHPESRTISTIGYGTKQQGLNGTPTGLTAIEGGAPGESFVANTISKQFFPVVVPFNPVAVSRIQLYQPSTVRDAAVVAIHAAH